MAFQVSPGINVSEIDLTTIVPAVATTEGAIAGTFRWGPVEKILLIDSEVKLAARYGKPTNLNAETFFSAANFLAYGKSLYVSRAYSNTDHRTAYANTGAVADPTLLRVKNSDHYDTVDGTIDTDVQYIAKYVGELGNSLKVSVVDSADQFSSTANLKSVASNTSFAGANTRLRVSVGSRTAVLELANSAALTSSTPLPHANTVRNLYSVGDLIEVGNSSIGVQNLKITAIGSVVVVNTAGTNSGFATVNLTLEDKYRLSTDWASQDVTRYWEYSGVTDTAPGQSDYVAANGNTAASDELHVVVVDEDGKFTGSKGQVLEVYKNLSRATDAKVSDGSTNYYKDVINKSSQYIWFANDRSTAVSNTSDNVVSSSAVTPLTLSFVGGADSAAENLLAFGDLARAWDQFKSAEKVDISLLVAGPSRSGDTYQLGNYLIDNIASQRKDCVAFVSPPKATVVNNGSRNEAQQVVSFRNNLTSSSYAVLDSGYKYQYDKYNDIYRWIPLNGDIAGLAVRTDYTNDPWWSPAGFNRGIIKNVVKLAFNPGQAERDLLYKNGINPVVTFPGQGTVLYGDKTLLAKPSAFDRINVRRLFIVLEKAISTASKYTLFEFNDEFTRAQFVNLIEPYLRDIKGRRGIYDFKVVCDETNNTPEVIDSNRFVGDIYIKPARSINYIQLNFVAVRTGVEFSEVVGKF